MNNKKAQDPNLISLYILKHIHVCEISSQRYMPELHSDNFRSINLLTSKKIKL